MLAWCSVVRCDAVRCSVVQGPAARALAAASRRLAPAAPPCTPHLCHHGWRGGKAGRGLRSQQRMCKSGVKKSDGDGEPVWAWWPMPAMVPTSRSSARNRHAASMPASWPGPPPTLQAPATPAATGRAQHQERVQVQRGGPQADPGRLHLTLTLVHSPPVLRPAGPRGQPPPRPHAPCPSPAVVVLQMGRTCRLLAVRCAGPAGNPLAPSHPPLKLIRKTWPGVTSRNEATRTWLLAFCRAGS